MAVPDFGLGAHACAEVAAGARLLGVELTDEMLSQLVEHARSVYEANLTLNLTRIAPESAVSLHILDSLTGTSAMSVAPDGPWADIGSGAGYPGIPLSIAAARHVDLLESVGKKARFLERVVADLCLDVTVRDCRAEEAALSTPAAYAALSARAVSALPSLVELAAPLLCAGGVLVCWKGAPDPEELVRGTRAAALVGMGLVDMHEWSVPGADVARTIIVYAKIGVARMALPRRPGMAQRQPVA